MVTWLTVTLPVGVFEDQPLLSVIHSSGTGGHAVRAVSKVGAHHTLVCTLSQERIMREDETIWGTEPRQRVRHCLCLVNDSNTGWTIYPWPSSHVCNLSAFYWGFLQHRQLSLQFSSNADQKQHDVSLSFLIYLPSFIFHLKIATYCFYYFSFFFLLFALVNFLFSIYASWIAVPALILILYFSCTMFVVTHQHGKVKYDVCENPLGKNKNRFALLTL